MTDEERAIERVNELLKQFDPEVAALNTVALQYAEPLLREDNFKRYANDSVLNNLLSVPGLPRDLKKKLIAGHMTAELTKAFGGVGDPRLPAIIAEIVAEDWCDRLPLPFGDNEDWIDRLNAAAGRPGYKPPDPAPKPKTRLSPWWGFVWAAVVAVAVGYLWLFAR